MVRCQDGAKERSHNLLVHGVAPPPPPPRDFFHFSFKRVRLFAAKAGSSEVPCA